MLQSLVDLNFVVKILRRWYGARPLLILADEVGRSDDEGLARQRLCQLMDSWAGQVSVVMSAFSDYEGAVNMFNASIRTVEFQILIVLGTDTFNCFQSVLTVWDRNRTKNAILAYRISLAWGATAGYARAVQYLTAELNKTRFKGPSGGSIMGCIAKLGDMGSEPPTPIQGRRAGGTARDVGLTGLPLPAAGSSQPHQVTAAGHIPGKRAGGGEANLTTTEAFYANSRSLACGLLVRELV